MKKHLLVFASLLFAVITQAKELSIHIKGIRNANTGTTEVNTKPGLTDTLTVKPGKDVSIIYISLTDERGEIYDYRCVSATYDDRISLITPSLPEGYVLNIYDDKGYVYRTELE